MLWYELSFILLNARSLNNKLQDFQAMVYSKDLDIVIVTETWLTPTVLDKEILPRDYDIYRRDRPTDRRGGGVLVAIKSDIQNKRRADLESNCELVDCEVHPAEGNTFIVCRFYRLPPPPPPPPSSSKDVYLTEFNKFLENAERESNF